MQRRINMAKQSEDVRAPFAFAGDDEYGNLKILSGTIQYRTEMPIAWASEAEYVEMWCEGGNVDFGFSRSNTSSVNRGAVATQDGTSAGVGTRLLDAAPPRTFKLPPMRSGGLDTLYLIHVASAASTTLWVELRSGTLEEV